MTQSLSISWTSKGNQRSLEILADQRMEKLLTQNRSKMRMMNKIINGSKERPENNQRLKVVILIWIKLL